MKKRRYFRYPVVEVYEAGQRMVKAGQTIIDTWHGKAHTYQVVNLEVEADQFPISAAYRVELIGEVTEPETLAQLAGKT